MWKKSIPFSYKNLIQHNVTRLIIYERCSVQESKKISRETNLNTNKTSVTL